MSLLQVWIAGVQALPSDAVHNWFDNLVDQPYNGRITDRSSLLCLDWFPCELGHGGKRSQHII